MEKGQSPQQVVLGKLDATCKSVKLEHSLTPYKETHNGLKT